MPSAIQQIYVLFLILFLTACSQKNIQKEQKVSSKKEEKKVEKEIIQKKKTIIYKFCEKHEKIMLHASAYIKDEFKNAYFLKNDIVGAKAQLFLIENKSPTVFAKNINAAIKSYKLHFDLSKKNGCDLNGFKIFPLEKLKRDIKFLEKKGK